jgi:hypothetical protein
MCQKTIFAGLSPVAAMPRALIAFLLPLALLATSGCAGFQRAVDTLDVWQANRCDCEVGNSVCGNHNCAAKDVVLGPPQGYLSEGANFTGEQIAGPPGKTALMRALELQDEVAKLKQENFELSQQLEIAKQKQNAQQEAMSVAQRELSRAMEDYAVMRRKLEAWYAELDQLDRQFQTGSRERDIAMDQFERELEAILADCQPTETAPTAIQEPSDPAADDTEDLTGASLGQPVPQEAANELPEAMREPDSELNGNEQILPPEFDPPTDEPQEVTDAPSAVSLVAPQNQSRRRVVMPQRR